MGDIVIRCDCGKMLYGDTLCADCGREYKECDICSEYYWMDEMVDGICTVCLTDVDNPL